MRIHGGRLINKWDIERIEDWLNYTYEVSMRNELRFEVSRWYMKSLKEMMGVN
ncbi:LytTR family transcriptional regulator DNA-binding domain-containing protein [Staphylococcus saprophyticus]|uniref:LytTR family transcriptional regulator DNA-binding domain-containing protein n=1 Tax=Staphylococcus saprophyticus TaxID=29385 RepID=UPI0021B2C4DB|nr:LytTR family transcriptional regulator DNA-binding domain-containing protein [Staphylococcus saprophyticus]